VEKNTARSGGVPRSSRGRFAHDKLRKLDRKIAMHLRVLRTEALLDPSTAKQRYIVAKSLDRQRTQIRNQLKYDAIPEPYRSRKSPPEGI
jgi:type II restriction/modification system DNA methylase subunit YeeA